jgi:hypothetical protein
MGMTIGVLCESGATIEPDDDLRLVAMHIVAIDKLAKKHKLAPLRPFFLESEEAEAGEEIEFRDPRVALATLEGLARILSEKPNALDDGEEIQAEITELIRCLRKAVNRKGGCRLLLS